MSRTTTHRRNPGDIAAARLAWLLLFVAVVGPIVIAGSGWDSVATGWYVAPAAGLLIIIALRLWPYRAGDHRKHALLEIVSWLIPAVDRFRKTVNDNLSRVRDNAQLINDMRSVARAYRLGEVDENTADEFASRREDSGFDVRELKRSDVAAFVADELDTKEKPGAGLPRCLEVLHADQFGEPTQLLMQEVDRSLLARIVVRHPLVANIDVDQPELRVRTILATLPAYDLDRVVDELREQPAAIVTNMENILKIYGLGELSAPDRATIAANLKAGQLDLPADCAHQVAARLEPTQPAWLLELLYRDRYARPTERLWSEHRAHTADIAAVLLGSTLSFAKAHRLDATDLVRILDAMETFDTSLITLVDLRLAGLSTLATHFGEYLRGEGVDCEVEPAEIAALVSGRFPVSTADLWRLRDAAVDLDVLRFVGRRCIAPHIHVPRDEPRPIAATNQPTEVVAPDDDALAVAVVAAGNYLAHHAIREGLLPDLARGAGRSDDNDRAAEVLLAQLWHEQSRNLGAGAVTVAELAAEFRGWLAAAEEDLGSAWRDVVGSITEELIQGHWPTKLPNDRTMAELLAHQVQIDDALSTIRKATPTHAELAALFEELRNEVGTHRLPATPANSADAETKLVAVTEDVRRQLVDLRTKWSDALSARVAEIVDRSVVVDTTVDTGREAAESRRELATEARAAAEASTAFFDRLSAGLAHLADEDRELGEQVGGLAEALSHTDTVLDEAVRDLELLIARDVCHSRHYILTFDSRTGPVGRLIDVLTTHPDFRDDYNFEHYTANARFGTMPDGMTFEQFHENLTADIARVFAQRKVLVPDYEWTWDHDLARTEVTLVLYATATRRNVFSGARWWRRSGSTADLPSGGFVDPCGGR